MKKLIVTTLFFLSTTETLAEVKNKEKAKFELISSIEIMVNIEECRKAIHADPQATVLPRACNSLTFLAKYFFEPKKDREAIEEFLVNEEVRVTERALKLIDTFKFRKLGKMTLSEKCVRNREPVDLDLYLNKIKGVVGPVEEPEISANKSDSNKLEIRNPAQEGLGL